MSVAAGGGAAKIDKTKLMMYGLGGGVLGIYLAHVLNEVTGTT
ncbi:MAG TPA: tetrahydromethanopterin S-methyltransferase subunit C, partial [Methanothrix sp.]|nr:tetrahydromethanopterin S-methyltransferase subunit C [Methanothrix sp.]